MEKNDLKDLFVQKAMLVSAVVHEVDDMAQALEKAVLICLEKPACDNMMPAVQRPDPRKVLAAPDLETGNFQALEALCKKNDICLIHDHLRDYPGGIEMGITTAAMGIAETGTLVQISDSEELRLTSMLCETHVAILDRTQIVETALDASQSLEDLIKGASSYTAFITGASRTADIERVLALGVHGPLELHIILTGEKL